jgi:hypothetical protein
MRPHWHEGVSPYRHGKLRGIDYDLEAHGRAGADVEHWLIRTLAKGAGYVYSPALQFALRQHALSYLRQWTKEPGWSTSQPYASRAMGWEAQSVLLMADNLADRELAQRVVDHAIARLSTITLSWIRGRRYWDVRTNDPRLGPGDWWMPWQQSVGAYWLDRFGDRFGLDELRAAALNGAKAVVDEAWREVGAEAIDDQDGFDDLVRKSLLGRHKEARRTAESGCTDATGYCLDNQGEEWFPSSQNELWEFALAKATAASPLPWVPCPIAPTIGGGPADPSFTFYGMALAPAVLLRHGSTDPRLRRLWDYLQRNAQDIGQTKWLAPEVRDA